MEKKTLKLIKISKIAHGKYMSQDLHVGLSPKFMFFTKRLYFGLLPHTAVIH